MKAVEDFIRENTSYCENIYWNKNGGFSYFPWLDPAKALEAAKIARDETIKEMCDWLDKNAYIYANMALYTGPMITDLKRYLEELE